MRTYKPEKYMKRLLGLCLMIFASTSCTHDYFEDETNFRLYVPQIKDGSIQNFQVAFHNENGKHVLTRELTAPFDKDEKMKEGILRFKLYPGNYRISCLADYTPGLVTTGNAFDDSFKGSNVIDAENNIYAVTATNPRSILTSVTTYPIGHPLAKEPVEMNMDNNRRFKGAVILEFSELPAAISRIDTYYTGVATAYRYDGTFRRFADEDRVLSSIATADHTQGNTVVIHNLMYPSAGSEFGIVPPAQAGTPPHAPLPLELEICFYDASDNSMGTVYFTETDFNGLPANKKPVDENGVTVSDLILRPQETIKITFKGFTVMNIDLIGWGDIIEGGTTPM